MPTHSSHSVFRAALVALALLAAPWLARPAAAQSGAPCDPAAACFNVNISQATTLGDFYLDGVFIVGGVNSVHLTTTPGVPHTVEVRNLQDPTVPGYGVLLVYPDQSFTQQLNPGVTWRAYFYPRTQYIRGTLQYTCLPYGWAAADQVACRVTIDGVPMPDLAPGAGASYTLDPGARAVHTDLVGAQANNWNTTARDDAPTITAGRTTWLTAAFTHKGVFKVSLLPAGLVGDIYLDGNFIVAQSAAVDLFTASGTVHTLEARNIQDPAAGARYRWAAASTTASVYAGGTRYVYLRPTKIWLQGSLSVLCSLSRKAAADDAACQVILNGTEIGRVAAGARGVFSLGLGTHSLTMAVVGASAGKWNGPVSTSVTIVGGGTTYYTGRFSLTPTTVTTPPNVAPVANSGFEFGGQVAGFDRPDLMRYAGMLWVKRQVRWSPGATADAGLINDAHAKGFKILLSVLGSPDDIRGGANYADYARFVGDLARFGADGIEVWNEMNIDREWPAGEIDPAKYTELLRQAYTSIKGANPGTLVISGAPAPTGAEGAFGRARVWNDNTFIAGMAAAGAANYLDCVGVHYNEGILSPTRSSGDPRDPYYTRYYSGMVSTYFNAFGGARKLCFTELGYLTPEGYGPLPGSFGWAANTTLANQAQWLAEAVSLARGSTTVRLIIIFNVDLTQYGDDPQAGFAMLRPGGGCPACEALHNLTGGR
ncbi:MAG: hypothetical protein IT317_19975 [Anaerolineales bacterium]|nr:hypothetical protein [Anaerolineales bacterium]